MYKKLSEFQQTQARGETRGNKHGTNVSLLRTSQNPKQNDLYVQRSAKMQELMAEKQTLDRLTIEKKKLDVLRANGAKVPKLSSVDYEERILRVKQNIMRLNMELGDLSRRSKDHMNRGFEQHFIDVANELLAGDVFDKIKKLAIVRTQRDE